MHSMTVSLTSYVARLTGFGVDIWTENPDSITMALKVRALSTTLTLQSLWV